MSESASMLTEEQARRIILRVLKQTGTNLSSATIQVILEELRREGLIR